MFIRQINGVDCGGDGVCCGNGSSGYCSGNGGGVDVVGGSSCGGDEYFISFSVRLLSFLRGHSGFSSPPQRPMTSDFDGFSLPDFIHYIHFPILIFEKEPVFSLLNVQC